MDNLDELRAYYGRLADKDLEALVAIDNEHLTPEARQVLGEEVARRQLGSAPALAPRVAVVNGLWVYPKARLGARLLAYIIDVVIGIFVPIAAAGIGLITSRGRFTVINVLLLISSIVWAFYYTFTKDAQDNGRSIGKRATGLMVVNITTNKPCSMGESALRALILQLINIVPLVGWLIEPMIALFSETGRRAGDLAAGTQVIEASAYVDESRLPSDY